MAMPMEKLEFKITDPQLIIELTRKMYRSNFFTIWAREVLQNSVDALAAAVEIGNESDANGLTKLSVKDNGVGMNKHIIYNKFLALGGSHKETASAVGGFGVAKSVVLAGDAKGKNPYGEDVYWFVRTTCVENGKRKTYYFDSEMMGKEAVKEVIAEENLGTEIVVFRNAYCRDEHIIKVLENSNVSTKLIYNGNEIIQLERARKKAEFDWCKVFYKKRCFEHQKGKAIVRIRGIYQYEERVSERMPGVVIFEIHTKTKPYEDNYPLTPNREQIRSVQGYMSDFNSVMEELQSPEMMRDEDEPFVLETYHNEAFDTNETTSFEEDINLEAKNQRLSEIKTRGLTKDELQEENIWAEEEGYFEKKEQEFQEDLKDILENDEKLREYKRKQRQDSDRKEKMAQAREAWNEFQNKKDFYFQGSTLNREMITEYNHQFLFNSRLPDITVKRDRGYKKGVAFNKKNLRALMCFKVMADMIFAVSKNYIPKFEYHIGFTLTDRAKAEFLRKDGKKYILLNPKGLNLSNIRLFTANVTQRLAHEMLHNDNSYHDEHFIATFHAVMENCVNPHIQEFERVARKILRGHSQKGE